MFNVIFSYILSYYIKFSPSKAIPSNLPFFQTKIMFFSQLGMHSKIKNPRSTHSGWKVNTTEVWNWDWNNSINSDHHVLPATQIGSTCTSFEIMFQKAVLSHCCHYKCGNLSSLSILPWVSYSATELNYDKSVIQISEKRGNK